MKKSLLLALALSIFLFGCDKNDAKTKATEAVPSDQIERPNQEMNDFQKKLLETTINQASVDYVLAKLPVWTEINLKYYDKLTEVFQSAEGNDLSFIDKVDGLRGELTKNGIEAEKFFPALEKTLHGYFFYNESANIKNNKAEFDRQMAELEQRLNSPDTPEEQKAQLKSIIEGSKNEMAMLQGTPPGFTEEEYKLIELNKEKIEKLLQEAQAKNQSQQPAE